MRKKIQKGKANIRNAGKQLKDVDKLFASLNKDKTLPTFTEHFVLCVMLGTSENVNLKVMYPALHKRIDTFLRTHSAKITAKID